MTKMRSVFFALCFGMLCVFGSASIGFAGGPASGTEAIAKEIARAALAAAQANLDRTQAAYDQAKAAYFSAANTQASAYAALQAALTTQKQAAVGNQVALQPVQETKGAFGLPTTHRDQTNALTDVDVGSGQNSALASANAAVAQAHLPD